MNKKQNYIASTNNSAISSYKKLTDVDHVGTPSESAEFIIDNNNTIKKTKISDLIQANPENAKKTENVVNSLKINGQDYKIEAYQEQANPDYLCFTAMEDNAELWMSKWGLAPTPQLQYSLNGTKWNEFKVYDDDDESVVGTSISLNNGQSVFFKGYNNTFSTWNPERESEFSADGDFDANTFYSDGSFKVSGDLTTIIRPEGHVKNLKIKIGEEDGQDVYNDGVFAYLFADYNSGLLNSPELPSEILPDNAYWYMFYYCQSLVNATKLPAKTVPYAGYIGMFMHCTALQSSAVMEAEIVEEYGCHKMYCDCSSLTYAYDLKTTQIALEGCYNMFYGTNITETPILPATTIGQGAYAFMFEYTPITKINAIDVLDIGPWAFRGMFQNCEELTDIWLPSQNAILGESCCCSMYDGCTGLIDLSHIMFGYHWSNNGGYTHLSKGCFMYMFQNCSSLIYSPYNLPDASLPDGCCQYMFNNCESLETLPYMNSSMLGKNCYKSTFQNCSKICLSETSTEKYTESISFRATPSSETAMNMFLNTGGTFTGTPTQRRYYKIPVQSVEDEPVAGDVKVFDGEKWSNQSGYGYTDGILDDSATISGFWRDSDTTYCAGDLAWSSELSSTFNILTTDYLGITCQVYIDSNPQPYNTEIKRNSDNSACCLGNPSWDWTEAMPFQIVRYDGYRSCYINISSQYIGTQSSHSFRVVCNGRVHKIDAKYIPTTESAVSSVNGKTGTVVLTGQDINMSPDEATSITNALNGKQAILAAGTGININNNTISYTATPLWAIWDAETSTLNLSTTAPTE